MIEWMNGCRAKIIHSTIQSFIQVFSHSPDSRQAFELVLPTTIQKTNSQIPNYKQNPIHNDQ
jgi:hypothetical protein